MVLDLIRSITFIEIRYEAHPFYRDQGQTLTNLFAILCLSGAAFWRTWDSSPMTYAKVRMFRATSGVRQLNSWGCAITCWADCFHLGLVQIRRTLDALERRLTRADRLRITARFERRQLKRKVKKDSCSTWRANLYGTVIHGAQSLFIIIWWYMVYIITSNYRIFVEYCDCLFTYIDLYMCVGWQTHTIL